MQKYRELLSSVPINPAKYRKGNIEKDFQADVSTHLRGLGWIAFHVPDIGPGFKFLDGILISTDGDTVLLEFKKVDGYTFNFSQFENSQIILLSKLSKRPKAEAYVPIYSQKTKTYVLHTFEELTAMKNEVGGCKVFSK